MTDRRGHAPHFIPLPDNELPVGLVKQQGAQRFRCSYLIKHVQFFGECIADAWSKAEAKQRCQSKHLLGTSSSVGVMLADMQVAFMMAQCIDHIECFLVRP